MRNSRLLPYDTKELRCSAAKSIEDALLQMARGNYVDHVIMQLSVKLKKKMKKGKPNPENCVTLDLFVISMRRR